MPATATKPNSSRIDGMAFRAQVMDDLKRAFPKALKSVLTEESRTSVRFTLTEISDRTLMRAFGKIQLRDVASEILAERLFTYPSVKDELMKGCQSVLNEFGLTYSSRGTLSIAA